MARVKSSQVSLEFSFFSYLCQFYGENRREIRKHYYDLSKRFLDFNDPQNRNAYLRQPQFEALEMYVFLKEYLGNAPVYEIFREWMNQEGKFTDRGDPSGQLHLLEEMTKEQYQPVFERMKSFNRNYSNYIFALTMGVGKTKLMATCIFYEFILANKYPKDARFCHNALVFAPDKTVLQSLREIETFEKKLVVPPEYINFLTANLHFHYLDETGVALSVMDKSKFNIIVSNTQKIILKRQNIKPSVADSLFGSGKPTYQNGSVYDEFADLLEAGDEEMLTTNQRFEKLRRLEQLGIYVDEAHHAFGNPLAKDMGIGRLGVTSLRLTIDELSASLERSGTRVVACYNYTGTPYVGQEILPEVVYAYGLREAIENKYLKKVLINSYSNTKSYEFINTVIADFVSQDFYQQRHEGYLPKLAFFADDINDLETNLKPALEDVLSAHGIPLSSILVNVGDPKLTSNDDIREFNRLDTFTSTKQFILLVGKGKEGWNCRSLFGVALFRQPKSKIFVLQATMRCLRSIGDAQQTACVYLSQDNRDILEDELQQNYRISVEELTSLGQNREVHQVYVEKFPVTIKLKRIRRQFSMEEKDLPIGIDFHLDEIDRSKYRLTRTIEDDLTALGKKRSITQDITDIKEQRQFSKLTLVAELSRYLNKPCLELESVLEESSEGIEKILAAVNEFNEILYDHMMPCLFKSFYEISDDDVHEEYEVDLIKMPPDGRGYYEVSAAKNLVAYKRDCTNQSHAEKTFHLNPYCFDSDPERNLFWNLIQDRKVKELYFTGMLTHGQSDFFVQYIDPDSHLVRSYYPDFLIRKDDGSYVIVEVKGDNKIDDPVVQAKSEFASRMAIASGMTYRMIKGSDAAKGYYFPLLTPDSVMSAPQQPFV